MQSLSVTARNINDQQPARNIARLVKESGSLKGKRVHIMGLAFRPEVKVDTYSPAYVLKEELLKQGAFVTLEDPLYTDEEIKKVIQKQKPILLEKHTLREIGIFGSYVRGEQKYDSDIDILIDFEEYPSLLEFIGIEDELSENLGIKVDLVMKSGLKPNIGKYILQEVIYI